MLLELLVKDGRSVTLDCAKATLNKDRTKIQIDDRYWNLGEVQGAIKMGLIGLVGDPPVLPPEEPKVGEEPRKKLRNAHNARLAFDCVKDYVDPGKSILIPLSKMNNKEVRNAMAWGLLVDAATPEPEPGAIIKKAPPVVIEELGSKDVMPDEKSVMDDKAFAAKPKEGPKPIHRASDPLEGGDKEEDTLFRPSHVIVPKDNIGKPKMAAKPAAKVVKPPSLPLPKSEAQDVKAGTSRFMDLFEDTDDKGTGEEEF